LTGVFRGSEHLGSYAVHGKTAEAICDSSLFSGVLELRPPMLLSVVTVELVEADHVPKLHWYHVLNQIGKRTLYPWGPSVRLGVFPDIDVLPNVTPRVVITVLGWSR
jgi:hypothetical protein